LTQNPDNQETRGYLLGTLTSDCKAHFEETILSTPETYEELLLVEEELIDEYVSGGLTKLEREQFETHFLITAARQKNLRFGQLLKRYVTSHPFPVAPPDLNAAALAPIEETAPAPKPFTFTVPGRRPLIAIRVAGMAWLGKVLPGWLTTKD
jgi:anti-sigma factor RsiW